jgi:peptide/nickel transport system substrate-binding protein
MNDSSSLQRLGNRRLSRRGAIRAGAIASATAFAAGCGAKPTIAPSGSGASASGAAAAGPPRRGGVLVNRLNTDPPSTWIPLGAVTYVAVHPFAPAYNQLVQWDPADPDVKITSDLADSHEIAGDGTSITFKIHPGVKFHDGSDFSSEDVRATIDWNKNPLSKQVSSQQGTVQVIDHVETPDPLTAKLVLKAPSPSLIGTLASHFMIMGAKADLARDDLGTTRLNGTGPFKLKSLTRGVGIELERNAGYWVKDRPYLDGVRFTIVFDENTAMTDMVAHRFDKYFPIVADNYGRVTKESAGRAKDYTVNGPNRRIVVFNGAKKPFNDVRVRQAVSLVLDRNEGLQLDVHGLGAAPGGFLQPGGQWAIPTDQLKKVPGYDKPDVAEAKKLLAAAGVGDPLSGVLLTRTDTTFQAQATWVQGTLQKVLGWNLKIDAKDNASAFQAAYAGQFDIITWTYAVTFDDPDAVFGNLCTRRASQNWSKIYDDEADALYDKQSQTLDTSERKKLVQQLENKYLNDFQLLNTYYNSSLHALWNNVQNYKVPSALYVNQRFQDVWLSQA